MSYTIPGDMDFLDDGTDEFRAVVASEEGSNLHAEAQEMPSKNRATDFKNVGPWEPKDLAFLDQHVFLSEASSCEDTYEYILEQLAENSRGFKNFREFPEEYKVVGYHFNDSRQGCYRVQLFEFEGKFGVNCTRLDGDALAVSQIWTLLKNALHESKFYEDPFLTQLENETDDEFFSDDEEFDMESFKFLDLSRDPHFVSKLVDEVEDLNVGTHALMLLNFNCGKESNLDFLASQFGQALFDKSVTRLAEDESRITLPDAVCISSLVRNMVAQTKIAVTAEQFKTLIDTADYWCVESGKRKTVVPTASEEAAHNLTSVLRPLLDSVSEEERSQIDSTAQLNAIVEKTNFDSVRDNVDAFLTSN